jgi:hypothetical protein
LLVEFDELILSGLKVFLNGLKEFVYDEGGTVVYKITFLMVFLA